MMKKDKFSFDGRSIIIWYKNGYITWIIMAEFFIHFFYVSIGKTKNYYGLAKNCIETRAFVIDVRKVGRKGDIKCTYTFQVNNLNYTGDVYDDDYKIGDTIQVLYLKTKPEINGGKKFLYKNYK